MSVSTTGQLLAFLGAFLIGISLGLLYDLLRPLRLRGPRWLEPILDLLYWIAVTLAVLMAAPLLDTGRVRIYLLIAHTLGAVCYFFLFSWVMRRLAALLERLLLRMFSTILRPFRRFFAIYTAALSLFFTKLKVYIKKTFFFFLIGTE